MPCTVNVVILHQNSLHVSRFGALVVTYVSLFPHGPVQVDRWDKSGFVKKLKRKDGCFYYFNHNRECPDREVHKTKLYAY